MVIDIKIDKHLEKYLKKKHFLKMKNKGNVLVLTSRDPIGFILKSLMRSAPKDFKPMRSCSGNWIKVESGGDSHAIAKPYISPRNTLLFKNCVEDFLNEELFMFVDACSNKRARKLNSIETCIGEFMKKYGIEEEDMSSETLKKRYYRHRKRVEMVE